METPVPNPVFLNVEYIFFLIYRAIARFFSFIFGDQFYPGLKIIATIVVIVLITIILYSLVRLYEIEHEKKDSKEASSEAVSTEGVSSVLGGNQIWESIRLKVLSDNPSDWRLGIIEADIYLDRILDQKGFFGDTLGDKLKQLTPEKLPSVQLAWEAHKVRNRIAHEGGDFTLTQPEARRALSYFEIVFRDLEVIA